MVSLLVILGILLLGTLAGWISHWALHQKWSGRFRIAHLAHHRLYPPSSLQSETYRDAAKDNTAFFLTPLITFMMLPWLGVLIWLNVGWLTFVLVVALGVWVGYLHDYIHEAFHIQHHWLEQFKWFRAIQQLHFGHHRRIGANLGILWFGWDRLFRTFKRS